MLHRVSARFRSVPPRLALLALGLVGLCLWAYWPDLTAMARRWLRDPQYSHGYLVPAFAVALLWLRREHLQNVSWQPSWWGVALLLAGGALRAAGTYLYLDWADAASLVPCLAGVVVLLGGWPALRWAWPALTFLLFMIPLPYRVETSLSGPLRELATDWSTYVLQTIGLPAVAEGHVILLNNDQRIGVEEACSGLSMLLIFFALATAVAVVCGRPLFDRVLIVVSALPIAVVANLARITATALALEYAGPEAAKAIFHDWAGWLMMPLALALLGAELWLLARLFPQVEEGPMAVGVKRPAAVTLQPPALDKKPRPGKAHRDKVYFPSLRRR